VNRSEKRSLKNLNKLRSNKFAAGLKAGTDELVDVSGVEIESSESHYRFQIKQMSRPHEPIFFPILARVGRNAHPVASTLTGI